MSSDQFSWTYWSLWSAFKLLQQTARNLPPSLSQIHHLEVIRWGVSRGVGSASLLRVRGVWLGFTVCSHVCWTKWKQEGLMGPRRPQHKTQKAEAARQEADKDSAWTRGGAAARERKEEVWRREEEKVTQPAAAVLNRCQEMRGSTRSLTSPRPAVGLGLACGARPMSKNVQPRGFWKIGSSSIWGRRATKGGVLGERWPEQECKQRLHKSWG